MARQAKIKQTSTTPWSEIILKRLSEGGFLLVTSVAVFLLLAFLSYNPGDPGWSHTGEHEKTLNLAGPAGAWFADFFLYVFGYLAYLIPLSMIYGSWRLLRQRAHWQWHLPLFGVRAIGFIFVLAAGCGLAALLFTGSTLLLPYTAGGIIGNLVASTLEGSFHQAGSLILLFALVLVGTTLAGGVSWLAMVEWIGWAVLTAVRYCGRQLLQLSGKFAQTVKQKLLYCQQAIRAYRQVRQQRREEALAAESAKPTRKILSRSTPTPAKAEVIEPVKKEPTISMPVTPSAAPPKLANSKPAKAFDDKPIKGAFPGFDLLDSQQRSQNIGYSNAELEEMSREVEQRLLDFGVTVQVVAVHPGPVITRFELQLAPGVKASKISGLAKDLARSLSVMSVRVVEVIPGKPVVGIELPNANREIVRIHEVFSSQQYEQSRSVLSLALGVDIAGHPVIVDLAKMPHLLVAGTTGSGKSVGINAMLLSLLYKATPQDVRLILIDPKMLELSVYDDIPHLLAPVVTDMKDAANALRWAVAEMERRYRLMAALGVRNISGYNQKVKAARKAGEALLDPLWRGDPEQEQAPELDNLPFIVIVIDELADMMMVVGKKVEQLIARIAQKARAAGIHLILATQRPSVDVLTGLIKSNVPTRISFQVSSKIDSRTILDQQGAETLLGHGDMLYLAPGTGTPTRVHGAFVDDHEVHNVTSDWKRRGQPEYVEAITSGVSEEVENLFPGESSDTEDVDPLYDEAVQFVIDSRKASISSVQRKLKVGYNRAARLIEEMERTGLVGPMEGGSRDVLVSAPDE